MNEEIRFEDFRLSIAALWKKKLLVIAATILTTLVGLLITLGMSPLNTYYAESTIYSAATGSYQEASSGTMAMLSYTDIVRSKKVCARAASILSGDVDVDATMIQNMIGVSSSSDAIVKIHATSTDPQLAVKVTNAVAEAFVREITVITGLDSIQVLDNADQYFVYKDATKDILKTRIIFFLVGLLLSSAWIICSELLSNRIRTVVQCIDESEDEILGIVPLIH